MVWPCHKGNRTPRLRHSAALGSRAARGDDKRVRIRVPGNSSISVVTPLKKMDVDQLDLNPRIIAAVKKGAFADVYIK